jgi:aspartyl-tRNA synthetase
VILAFKSSYKMTYRTHTLDQIDENLIGQEVIVSGWVNSTRDH